MNPEIWCLIQDAEIERALRDSTDAAKTPIRSFASVADLLSREEPPGGVVLAIDAVGKFKNYPAIIKRFQKGVFGFEVAVFGPRIGGAEEERQRALGVDRYLAAPVDRDELSVAFSEMIDLRRIKSAAGIIGRSPQMDEMLQTLLRVAPTEVPVLIEGESGSGKEVTARAIHLMSKRAERSFEAVNCGALAEGILESELFGHERGSFTGAVARRQGLFERAHHGTLFLDEVGEMSLNMQVKLLRVIETGELLRVGGSERVRTDARIVAATNRELETAVERGSFRKDLYYRLKVVQVRIPPLRARPDDIALLVNFFLKRAAVKHGKKIRGVEKEGMDILVSFSWPGNVRELANVIDNLTILSDDGTIRTSEIEKRLKDRSGETSFPDLPVHVPKSKEDLERELIMNSLLSIHNDMKEALRILKGERAPAGGGWRGFVEVKEAGAEEPRNLERMQLDAIRAALAASGGNRRKAAKALGVSERTLYRRIKQFNLG